MISGTQTPSTRSLRLRRHISGSSSLQAAGVFAILVIAASCAPAAAHHRSRGSASRATEPEAVRPFHVHVAEADLVDLRHRLVTTRWPDRETVDDRTQGVRLDKLRDLVRYWATDYNWRKAEARLNALPQFVTQIDGLDIHFLHVRSPHPNAMPMVITHGWPGSIFELLKVIDPLTDPTAHGGRIEDAFDVVIPSIPGYGISGRPSVPGWDPDRIARAWAELMRRLGYHRYVAQGGDWGAIVSQAMARQAAPGLNAIHVNLPATVPPEVEAAVAGGGPPPAGLSEEERATFDGLTTYRKGGSSAYSTMLMARPQTVGYGMTDSPAGLAAWILLHPGFAPWSFGNDPNESPTRDEVLDDISLYWLTNSATSSARLYWENRGRSPLSAAAQRTGEITVPVAVTVFPKEVYRAPKSWARRAYPNLLYFNEVDEGGHFAAWEQPDLFSEELRAAFRSVR